MRALCLPPLDLNVVVDGGVLVDVVEVVVVSVCVCVL